MDPTGPENARQLPSVAGGEPGQNTPVNPVLPSWTQLVKSPVSKLPLLTRFGAAFAATAMPIVTTAAPNHFVAPCITERLTTDSTHRLIWILLLHQLRR